MTFQTLLYFMMLSCVLGVAIWTAVAAGALVRGWFVRREAASDRSDISAADPVAVEDGHRAPGLGQWDIAPGESRRNDGSRDVVLEASMQSFPASDPPAY